MVSLFAEIWDMILDCLHDDYKSLGECSLVTRDWISTCRNHRFSTLMLLEQDKEEDIKSVFEDPLCTITPSVRKLVIYDGGKGPRQGKPFSHLPVFPFVREIKFDRINWPLGDAKSETWVLGQMAQVITLVIVWPTWYNELRRVMAAAPDLLYLHIEGPESFIGGPGQSAHFNVKPPRLRKLNLVGLSTRSHRAILDWISPLSDGIEDVRIQDRENMTPTTLAFLGSVASQLKHLTLHVGYIKNYGIQGM